MVVKPRKQKRVEPRVKEQAMKTFDFAPNNDTDPVIVTQTELDTLESGKHVNNTVIDFYIK
jgi:Ulp1 family protease